MREILDATMQVKEGTYFPVIMRKPGLLIVAYRDHSETYKLSDTYRGTKEQPYDPYDEIKMARDNGCKEIHGKEDSMA
jgi:hypothetical protein